MLPFSQPRERVATKATLLITETVDICKSSFHQKVTGRTGMNYGRKLNCQAISKEGINRDLSWFLDMTKQITGQQKNDATEVNAPMDIKEIIDYKHGFYRQRLFASVVWKRFHWLSTRDNRFRMERFHVEAHPKNLFWRAPYLVTFLPPRSWLVSQSKGKWYGACERIILTCHPPSFFLVRPFYNGVGNPVSCWCL